MPSGRNEVETAVDAVVIKDFSYHPRLFIQVVLKLGVDVFDDGIPAGQGGHR